VPEQAGPAGEARRVLGDDRDRCDHVGGAVDEGSFERAGDRVEIDAIAERGAPVDDDRDAAGEIDDDLRALGAEWDHDVSPWWHRASARR
jgi:hypothetical protein